MFWPDEKDLKRQPWWLTEAWGDGPTYGELMGALQPVLRVAALHGYRLSSINIGFGAGYLGIAEWQRIDLETLQMLPGELVSPFLPDDGPGIWFDIAEVADLIGEDADSYGTGLVVPVFSGLYTDDHSVPAEMVDAITAFVEGAITDLAGRVTTQVPMPRSNGNGLLWIFDVNWWFPKPLTISSIAGKVRGELLANPVPFLRGQVFGDRSQHRPDEPSGPASLSFLLSCSGGSAAQLHSAFYTELLWELQVVGGATRMNESERRLHRNPDTTLTWLDALAALLRRGVIVIEGLLDAGEPPEPLAAQVVEVDGDDAVNKIVLWVWGTNAITLRRENDFPDQAAPGLLGSVSWDYVRGDSQVRPTVMIVAGRGVAIDHSIDSSKKPWDLLIFRVQDDAQVPAIGQLVDPARLLACQQIEPYDEECVGPVTDEYVASYPQVMVKPKPDGVFLVFPTAPGVMPTEITGAVSGYAPAVIELTVDPKSGKDAYTFDVHYFTDTFFGIQWSFAGGAHVSIWATEGVKIHSNMSDNEGAPAAGNPSTLVGFPNAHMVVAELWHSDRPELLARPGRAELPVLPWSVAAPLGFWSTQLWQLFEIYAPQSVLDFFSGDREHPFPQPEPSQLEYFSDLRRADWFDEWGTQEFIGLTPAPHSYRQYQYTDTLLFDLLDVVVGFMPVIGDIADVGETVYACQTGLDRWGRPVSKLQLALMVVCTAIPFVSTAFAKKFVSMIQATPADELARPATMEELARLSGSADRYDNVPLDQALAAMGEPSLVRAAPVAGDSPSRRVLSGELAATLGAQLGPIAGLADDLLAGKVQGWITAADLLAKNPVTGFADAPLQMAFLRQLRRDQSVTPLEFFGKFNGN